MNLTEHTITVRPLSEKARLKELHRRKLQSARADFIGGDENLDELAARYQVPRADLTRKSRREGWPSLRADKRAELDKKAVARCYQHVGQKQVSFIAATSKLLDRLEKLIHREMTRVEGDEPDKFGNAPSGADVHMIAKTLKTFVDSGRALYKMDKPIPTEDPAEVEDWKSNALDCEPLADPPQIDPMALELPAPQ